MSGRSASLSVSRNSPMQPPRASPPAGPAPSPPVVSAPTYLAAAGAFSSLLSTKPLHVPLPASAPAPAAPAAFVPPSARELLLQSSGAPLQDRLLLLLSRLETSLTAEPGAYLCPALFLPHALWHPTLPAFAPAAGSAAATTPARELRVAAYAAKHAYLRGLAHALAQLSAGVDAALEKHPAVAPLLAVAPVVPPPAPAHTQSSAATAAGKDGNDDEDGGAVCSPVAAADSAFADSTFSIHSNAAAAAAEAMSGSADWAGLVSCVAQLAATAAAAAQRVWELERALAADAACVPALSLSQPASIATVSSAVPSAAAVGGAGAATSAVDAAPSDSEAALYAARLFAVDVVAQSYNNNNNTAALTTLTVSVPGTELPRDRAPPSMDVVGWEADLFRPPRSPSSSSNGFGGGALVGAREAEATLFGVLLEPLLLARAASAAAGADAAAIGGAGRVSVAAVRRLHGPQAAAAAAAMPSVAASVPVPVAPAAPAQVAPAASSSGFGFFSRMKRMVQSVVTEATRFGRSAVAARLTNEQART